MNYRGIVSAAMNEITKHNKQRLGEHRGGKIRTPIERRPSLKKFYLGTIEYYVDYPKQFQEHVKALQEFFFVERRHHEPIKGRLPSLMDATFLLDPNNPSKIQFDFQNDSCIIVENGKVIFYEIVVESKELSYILQEDSSKSMEERLEGGIVYEGLIPKSDHLICQRRIYLIGPESREITEYYRFQYLKNIIKDSCEPSFRIDKDLSKQVAQYIMDRSEGFSWGDKAEIFRGEIKPEEKKDENHLLKVLKPNRIQMRENPFSNDETYEKYIKTLENYIRMFSYASIALQETCQNAEKPGKQVQVAILGKARKKQEEEIQALKNDLQQEAGDKSGQ